MTTSRSITFRPCKRKLLFQTRDVLFQGDVLGSFVLELEGQFGKSKTPTDIATAATVDTTAAGVMGGNVMLFV